ncbi:MAG: serine/threonine protein kinase, partial [Eubacterium sp.]|nr:serine/threonine protein kinase [Eubacterium sp.]
MQDRDLHVLSPGTKLNNRYVIDGIIGEGGFGITYKGRDELLRVTVAVKEFYPHGVVVRNNTVNDNLTVTNMAQNEMFERGKEKFLQEAQIIAQFVDQDGIVNVTDFFEENNTAYIVMEYLSGVTLKEYINQNGAISPVDMLNLTVPVIEALDRIHREGLIHRDISPDNIMLLENGKVKLMDFGAARDYTEFGEKSLSIVLKPGYAPEEQYRSRGVQGPWTDIYALSATIYKCITGITPDESMQRVMEDDIKSPSELHIDIPAGMERAIMKGMSVRAADRYQNLSDFSADLYGDFEEETGTPSTRQPRDDSPAGGRWSTSGGKTVSRSSGSSSSSRGTAAGEPKKKNNVLIIGGAAAAFVVVIIAFLIGRSGSGGQKAALSNSAPSVVTESPDSAGSDSDQVSSDADSSQEAVTEAVTEAEESTEAALTEVSDDLMDYTFQLKDKVYQLPFKYERLKEDGWMMTTSNGDMTEETLLASDEQELIFLTDGTEYAHVGFNVYNPSDNAVKIGESYVCGIIVN